MNKNTTHEIEIQPGERFTAFDLYDMSDVTSDENLYGNCVQYCTFIRWSADGALVRIADHTNGKEFWSSPDDVQIIAAGWMIPDLRSELAVA